MPRQTVTEDVTMRPAVPNAASEKVEPDAQKIPCRESVHDSIQVPDVPGTVVSYEGTTGDMMSKTLGMNNDIYA